MKIWGTSPESIDEAEDRDKWYKILTKLDIKQPPGDMVTSEEGAIKVAYRTGLPCYGTAVVCAWRTRHGNRLRVSPHFTGLRRP